MICFFKKFKQKIDIDFENKIKWSYFDNMYWDLTTWVNLFCIFETKIKYLSWLIFKVAVIKI